MTNYCSINLLGVSGRFPLSGSSIWRLFNHVHATIVNDQQGWRGVQGWRHSANINEQSWVASSCMCPTREFSDTTGIVFRNVICMRITTTSKSKYYSDMHLDYLP
ncbi:hypothetical protein H0G86_011431 [Trichoderma simmonsii]|uniref:Uncharacterized protein n=1 Tax=Trichoderma simmonsii TaxID=1491479 RepID=A0A8G0LLK2_9HYPO|nr:hypothetical protein H0G86_011431 [Trichoderma simmonsii]